MKAHLKQSGNQPNNQTHGGCNKQKMGQHTETQILKRSKQNWKSQTEIKTAKQCQLSPTKGSVKNITKDNWKEDMTVGKMFETR